MFNKYFFKESTPVDIILYNVYPGFFDDHFSTTKNTPYEAWQIVASLMMLNHLDEKTILDLISILGATDLFDEGIDCALDNGGTEPPYLMNGHHRFVAALLTDTKNIKINYHLMDERSYLSNNVPLFGFMETELKLLNNQQFPYEDIVDEFFCLKSDDNKIWIKSLGLASVGGEMSITWEPNNYLLNPEDIDKMVNKQVEELKLGETYAETKFIIENYFT